jgi:hypothetical protein
MGISIILRKTHFQLQPVDKKHHTNEKPPWIKGGFVAYYF